MRSLQTTRNAAFKAALLAGGAGVIALAQPAYAQDTTTKEPVVTTPDQPEGSQANRCSGAQSCPQRCVFIVEVSRNRAAKRD